MRTPEYYKWRRGVIWFDDCYTLRPRLKFIFDSCMMAQRLDLAPLSPFDPFTEPNSLGQRWKAWRRRFQTYLLAMNITDPTQQRALLLYQVGQHTQDIFDTIPNNGQPADYDTAMRKLEEYFLPKRNVTYEIFQFRQAVQQPGESVDQYATRLRKLAEYCEFANINSKNPVNNRSTLFLTAAPSIRPPRRPADFRQSPHQSKSVRR